MAPRSLILSSHDLEFLLYDWLDIASLTDRPRYAEHSRESLDAVLALCAEIAEERFAPHNRSNDENEPRLIAGGTVEVNPEIAAALGAIAKAGILAATMDAEVGGLQLPRAVGAACNAWFAAANVGTWAYAALTIANVRLLLAHASPELVERFVAPMLAGRAHGTMCLSEPHAGSSLADIRTRAEPDEDDSYRLHGHKMWISGGDHEIGENIVHLVLARLEGAPPGTRGISLFVVPKRLVGPDGVLGERNDVTCTGLNHKMGYRGTVNAALALGEGDHTPGGRPGAVGYLVGTPNQGLAAMFDMMNEARIEVGAGAAALGVTGYLKSVEYARDRVQGRLPSNRDPTSDPVPLTAHRDVRRMLMAQKSYAEGALALVLYCGRLVDDAETAPDGEARARSALLLDVLTPIVKSWPAQWCLAANDLAIQVLGGAGYTRDFDLEQHYRDNRLNMIHEGTHGIHAVDLLGRRLAAGDGEGLRVLVERIRSTLNRAQAAGGDASALAHQLGRHADRLVEVTTLLHAHPDVDVRLADATAHLEATGHIVLAWVWLELFLTAGDADDDLRRGKRAAARYFFRYELPGVGPRLDLLADLDATAADLESAWS